MAKISASSTNQGQPPTSFWEGPETESFSDVANMVQWEVLFRRTVGTGIAARINDPLPQFPVTRVSRIGSCLEPPLYSLQMVSGIGTRISFRPCLFPGIEVCGSNFPILGRTGQSPPSTQCEPS
jgi:hypothetical protein